MNRYGDWLLTLFCWDGILPFAVVAIPQLVTFMLPGNQDAQTLTFLAVPITAFLVRAANGAKRFRTGQLYRWQAVVFGLAIFFLVGLDAALILLHLSNKGVTVTAWLMWLAFYAAYLMTMAIALFPARAAIVDARNQPNPDLYT